MRSPLDKLLDSVDWEPVEYTHAPSPDGLPHMVSQGVLRIGGIELQCAVLSDGERIFYGPEIEALMGCMSEREGA